MFYLIFTKLTHVVGSNNAGIVCLKAFGFYFPASKFYPPFLELTLLNLFEQNVTIFPRFTVIRVHYSISRAGAATDLTSPNRSEYCRRSRTP